jgi:hypothetical protein
MTNNQNTVSGTGSSLMGAGLILISDDPQLGLVLIGVGVVLNILVAWLQKKGLEVRASNLG